jgi:hypothetical protein
VNELKQPDENMNTLMTRALDALRRRVPGTVTPAQLDPVQRKAALVARLQALQAIANRLNSEEVPTLSGRGGWKAGTVGNLLAEAKAAQV